MQRLYIILTLLSFSIIYCQNNEKDDYKRLIDSAIVLKHLKNNLGKYYIINSDNAPYLLSNSLKSKGLETISIYDKKNKRIFNKGINVWKVLPSLEGNTLKIVIIDFLVTYSRGAYQFSNGGGSTFIYEYSCRSKNWEMISEKHSGI